MGEAEKKAPEEKEIVDEKKESSGGDEEKEAEGETKADPPPPPPPEEVVMKVYMHCEACARKVKRCLRRIEGVESVVANSGDYIVVVKGKKAAENPMRMVERVQRKCGRKVELITPFPSPEPKPAVVEPQVISVVLRVYMHCEACSKAIKKRILKMKGVQEVEPDLNNHEVTVNGVFDPEKLAECVRKRTGKYAVVLKQELPPPPSEQKAEEEKKPEGGEKTLDKPEGEVEKKGQDAGEEKEAKEKDKQSDAEDAGDRAPSAVTASTIVDSSGKVAGVMNKNRFYYYCPMYPVEHSYPPQIFSDENPNACIVM